MILLLVYCIGLYLFGLYAMFQTYQEEGELTVMDFLMVIMSPVSMLTVMITHLLSNLVDLDAVIIRKPDL